MAINRRSSSRRISTRRPRRKLVWARSADGVIVGGSTSTVVRNPLGQFEGSLGANLIGCTIMAIRGTITCAMVPPSTGEAFAAVRVAARITDHADLNQLDYADGALYGNQAQADWFLFEPFMLDGSVVLADGDQPEATTATETRIINNRARRKLDELTETVELLIGAPAVGSTTPPANTVPVRVRYDLSFLVALS